MAELTVGTLLAKFLTHHYDNETAVRTLHARGDTRIEIYHGQNDHSIPMRMGKALKELGGDSTTFFEIAGAGHNDILDRIALHLRKTVSQP